MTAARTHSASPGPFRVLVRDLPTHKKVDVAGPFVASVLSGLPMREALARPADDAEAGGGALDVELYADGTHCFANGTMRGHIVVACSRCVGPAKVAIDEAVHVTFVPPGEIPAEADGDADQTKDEDSDEAGTEVAAGDQDVFPYDGETVDLEPLIREHFVLAVPYAPLCKDDCRGLCPQCGIDKNVEACTCEPPPDPRFAALKGLKLPS